MSKYRNVKTVVDGITFDSKKEAKHYQHLKFRVMAKEIWELRVQVPFPLEINGIVVCTYVADFTFKVAGEQKINVLDVKGVKTPVYRLKKKLMKAILGIEILEV